MFKAPTDWNTLPAAIRSLASLGIFKHCYLTFSWAALVITDIDETDLLDCLKL